MTHRSLPQRFRSPSRAKTSVFLIPVRTATRTIRLSFVDIYLVACLRPVWGGGYHPFWNPGRTPWRKTHHQIVGRIYTLKRRKRYFVSNFTKYKGVRRTTHPPQKKMRHGHKSHSLDKPDGICSTLAACTHKDCITQIRLMRGRLFSSRTSYVNLPCFSDQNRVSRTSRCALARSTNKSCRQEQYI